jgi:RNA polymerase-binding protein DksA
LLRETPVAKKGPAKKSGKGAGKTTRRARSSNSVPGAAQKSAESDAQPAEKPMPKTKYSTEDLQEFRQLLLDKRAELIGDVSHMTSEALRDSQPGGSGNLSNVPIHMADIGSDNWEQEFTLGLVANERARLKEIDSALQRIADRTYGVCEASHKPIGKQRLRAKPWARYCIEAAREKELGGAP